MRYFCSFTIVYCFAAIQVDYDLSFTDPTRSSAALVLPFFLGGKTSMTIGMWVQFTQKDEGGVFFTMYQVGLVPHIFHISNYLIRKQQY